MTRPVGLLLAVDGGNSKTDVVLADTGGHVLGRASGDGTNHQTAGGIPAAMSRLDALVHAALAGRDQVEPGRGDQVELVVACLAGADLPAELAALRAAVAAAGWARRSIVDNDSLALLRAGTDSRDAVAVVCGAGVNCVARAADGRMVRFPALGELTGDWGGGQHLGRLALWHAVRAEDGRGPATALATAVAAHFGQPSATDVAVAVQLGQLSRRRFGELSPVLFRVARAGDEVARRVVLRQGQEVVAFATAAMRRLDLLGTDVDVVLGGGVLRARDPLLHDTIEAGLHAAAPHARIGVVTAPPVLGAARLALDALGAAADAHATLRAQLA